MLTVVCVRFNHGLTPTRHGTLSRRYRTVPHSALVFSCDDAVLQRVQSWTTCMAWATSGPISSCFEPTHPWFVSFVVCPFNRVSCLLRVYSSSQSRGPDRNELVAEDGQDLRNQLFDGEGMIRAVIFCCGSRLCRHHRRFFRSKLSAGENQCNTDPPP